MTDTQADAPLPGRFDVVRQGLRNPRLRRVLFAYLVFNIQEWATYVTLLVWAYAEHGVRGASVIALAQLIPSAVLASPLVAVVGRRSPRHALPVGYTAQAVTLFVLAGVLLVSPPFAVVASAAALAAVTVTLTRPAHNAVLPAISDTTGDLTTGNAASGAVEAAAAFLGPLASGLLITVWEPAGVVLTMGVGTALAAAVTARGLIDRPPSAFPTLLTPRQSSRAVRGNPAARLLCGLVAAEYALVGMMDILLVVLALDLLGMSQAGPGILNSAIGIGGLVGAAFTFVLIGRSRLAPAVVLGALGAGLPFVVAGLVTVPAAAVALIAMCGAGKLFFDVASRTFVQRLLPDRLLTATFGLQESLMMAGLAVGTLSAPLLVELLGARGAFFVAGAFLPLVALLAASRLRRLDLTTAVPADVLELLRGVPFLTVLAPRIVERLAREADPVAEPAGAVLVAEGGTGDHFYVIGSGRVVVTQGATTIRELGPGAWFGELALLRDVPRTATVTALTPVALWSLEREPFLASVGLVARAREVGENHARENYR